MAKQLTKGELLEYAEQQGIDINVEAVTYQELRKEIDIKECKQCGQEYVTGWREDYCSETCEVKYINENF